MYTYTYMYARPPPRSTPGLFWYEAQHDWHSTFKAPKCNSAVLSQKLGMGKPGILRQHSTFAVPECKRAVLSQSFCSETQKMLYCPNEPRKPMFQEPTAGRSLKVLGRLVFKVFWDNTAPFWFRTKKIETVHHFQGSRVQQCCSVPETWLGQTRNFLTAQHVCSPGEQKCCTDPLNASCRTRTPGFQGCWVSLHRIQKGFIWPKASTPKP